MSDDQSVKSPGFVGDLYAAIRAAGGEARLLRYRRQGGGKCEAFWARPAQARRGVIIALHATGNDKYYTFVQIYRDLINAGFAVFAFDLDGHGRGSTHQLSVAHIDSMVPQAIAEAKNLAPDTPVHLLGQSLGALLILRFLQQQSEAGAVRSAMLLAAPVSGRILKRAVWREAFAVSRPAFWQAVAVYGPWGLVPALGAFKRRDYPLRFGGSVPRVSVYGGLVDQLVRDFAQGSQDVGRICPCFMMYGEKDAVTPPSQAAPVRAKLMAPSAWQVVEGETHFTLPLSRRCRLLLGAWLDANR